MNQAIHEQLELGSRKSLFMFIYLVNKPSSNIVMCLWTSL